jgi:hypothetical protein
VPTVSRGHGARRLVAFVLAALTVLAGLNAPRARADVADSHTAFIDMHLDYDIDNRGHYLEVIRQLRAAAGHVYRANVYETSGTARPSGLIALNLFDQNWNAQTTIFFNPQNLYIAGFKARNGQSYIFADASSNSTSEVYRHAAVSGGPEPRFLNFEGNYAGSRGLINTAIHGEERAVGLQGMIDSMRALGNVPNIAYATGVGRGVIASHLLRMVGAFAEAARFPLFRDRFERVFGYHASTQNIVTDLMVQLRSQWAAMSEWVRRFGNDPTTPEGNFGHGLDGPGNDRTIRLGRWAHVEEWMRSINGPSR